MKILDDLHAFLWFNPGANNCNSFLIHGSKKILVDPGHASLFGHVRDNLEGLSLGPGDMDLVIATHGHPDHIEGLPLFKEAPASTALHFLELDFIKERAPHYGESIRVGDFEPDLLLQDGDLVVGDDHFQVLHTPGHSPGSVCLYWPARKALFTGDVVFNQGVGRTDLPGGSGEELKESIRKISRLDVEILLPGHGDIIQGADFVKANFSEIERAWFAYL